MFRKTTKIVVVSILSLGLLVGMPSVFANDNTTMSAPQDSSLDVFTEEVPDATLKTESNFIEKFEYVTIGPGEEELVEIVFPSNDTDGNFKKELIAPFKLLNSTWSFNNWTIAAGKIITDTTPHALAANTQLDISASWTPIDAGQVRVGVIDNTSTPSFFAVDGTKGAVSGTVTVDAAGTYYIRVRNYGTKEIAISGYVSTK